MMLLPWTFSQFNMLLPGGTPVCSYDASQSSHLLTITPPSVLFSQQPVEELNIEKAEETL